MSSVNVASREISIKIVYYGPGLGGKTSSLQFIHRSLRADARGQLVSLATGVDRTLYFDFLPVTLPKLRGYGIRVQLYTVPGQVHYNSTRKLVLAGCDGVVFVADSQRDRDVANIESFENLGENLAEQGLRLEQLPHVLQLNKRDAPDVLPVEELYARLNPYGGPAFETVATTGRGIFDGLKSITTLVLDSLRRRGLWDASDRPVARGDSGPHATGLSAAERGSGPSQGQGPPGLPGPAGTIEQRLAALSEAADAMAHLEPRRDRSPTGPLLPLAAPTAVPSSLSAPLLVPRAAGGVARVPSAPRIPQVDGIAELVPAGAARERAMGVEAEISRGDYAAAIRLAARAFTEAARAESVPSEVAPPLHALNLGLGARRYRRFCEVAERADTGSVGPEDALFALFFLVDAALDR